MREDVAAAAVNLMCEQAATFAFSTALTWNVKNVIACGSFFNHPSVWPKVSSSYLEESLAYKLEVKLFAFFLCICFKIFDVCVLFF